MHDPDELTDGELDVVLYLLNDLDHGDPLKHHDNPSLAYKFAENARKKLQRVAAERGL
jgi:hypothetical protein